MKDVNKVLALWLALFVLASAIILAACGGKKTPAPSILNINSSTDPSSPVGLAIEINGSNFLSVPGEVRFTQGSITARVVPDASGWSDTGIVVVVPAGDGTTNFTVPGTVVVTVVTKGGTSNAVDLDLVLTITFDVNNVTWTTTTALPTARTGLAAVAVPVSSSSAFLVVTGGFNGTANLATVHSNSLATDGQVGGSWTAISTNALPVPRAHHAMVVAHPGNSLVSTTARFIYVLGGQENSTDAPGGSAKVFRASLDVATGTVSAWTELTTPLPAPVIGAAAALFNGHIYVVGGLQPNGTPSTQVFTTRVNSDGTLQAWSTSSNAYPVAISFATAFGFGGKLYVLNGDTGTSTNPNEQGSPGVKTVRFASARNGVVGTWISTAETIKQRKKHVTWTAFGQVIDAEGVYEGIAGSLELERSLIQSDGTLAAWNGITATANQIGANVYNAAAVVSPLQSPSGNPRFLLLGGQRFVASPPGALSAVVYYNNMP